MVIFLTIAGIIAVAVTVVLLYYNKALPEVQDVADTLEKDGKVYYLHGDSDVGFIIFSGAKVDEKGYAYMAKLLHDEGHTVAIPEVPFHLSAFGTNRGYEIMEANPQIEKWFLIGHSIGGVPISRIAAENPDKLEGIAFVASIMSTDLSELDISAIHIMASNDNFYSESDREKEHLEYLPEHSFVTTIEGASHQDFATVRGRDGGGTISWQEQQEQAVRLMLDFFDDRIGDGSEGGR